MSLASWLSDLVVVVAIESEIREGSLNGRDNASAEQRNESEGAPC